jgi:hypothetical protein
MPLANDNILSKPMITKVAAYGLSLSHIFCSIQETQREWNKNIFGERGLKIGLRRSTLYKNCPEC